VNWLPPYAHFSKAYAKDYSLFVIFLKLLSFSNIVLIQSLVVCNKNASLWKIWFALTLRIAVASIVYSVTYTTRAKSFVGPRT
jgi:hypothetical protein